MFIFAREIDHQLARREGCGGSELAQLPDSLAVSGLSAGTEKYILCFVQVSCQT